MLATRVRQRLAALPHPPASLPLSEVCFVAFDTETTGFHPEHGDEVISLGAVILQGGELKREHSFHQLVNPGRPVPRVVQNLTGLTDEAVRREGIAFLEAFDRFLDFAGEAILVGHGADFDLAFLEHKLWQTCRGRLRHLVLDTRRLYHLFCPESEDYSLDALLSHHGIPAVGRHTALGDALLAGELFRRLLPALAARHCLTVRGLRRYALRHPHSVLCSLGCLV